MDRSCRAPVHTIKFKASGYRSGSWYPNLTKGLGFKTSQALPIDCEYGTQLVYDRRRWFAIIPQHVKSVPTQNGKVIALDPFVKDVPNWLRWRIGLRVWSGRYWTNREIMSSPGQIDG